MNKELILKYKAEFDHWLNGGDILYKHKNSLAWWTTNCWDYDLNYVQAIIIKDEYVEFRKALAEGKNIQYKDREGFWNKIEYKLEEYHLEELRIKPEEPKFKVGDWVKIITFPNHIPVQIKTLKDNGYILSTNLYTDVHLLESWQPKPGEWCWFWDTRVETPILAKFTTMYKNNYGCAVENEHIKHSYNNCEPFISELPTILKET